MRASHELKQRGRWSCHYEKVAVDVTHIDENNNTAVRLLPFAAFCSGMELGWD
jgi:hypothetical protein